MEHLERRQHIERILEELSTQRRVDMDEVLMELIHVVLELEDRVKQLDERLSRLEPRG